MSNLQNDDLILVSREGVNYELSYADMSNLQNDDLLLVSRDGVNYKVTADQFSIAPPEAPSISATLTDLNVSDGRFTDEQFKIDVSVNPGARQTVQEVKPYVVSTYVPPEPEGSDLFGLRFDPARSTILTNSGGGSAVADFSISVWVKPTSDTSSKIITSYTGNDRDDFGWTTNYKVYAIIGQNVQSDVATLTPNIWQHLVWNRSGSTNKVYLNGVEQSSWSNGTTVKWLQTLTGIGELYTTNNETLNGYLSDFYLVDNQALDPSVFAGTVDGKWIPKGTPEITAGIEVGPENPYDTRPNYDQGSFGANGFHLPFDPAATGQVWSTDVSVSGSYLSNDYGPEKMFNGVLNERTVPSVGSTVTWQIPQINAVQGSVKLWMRRRGSTSVFLVNGTDYRTTLTSTLADDTEGWVTIPETSLYSISFARINDSDYGDVGAVEVDGKLLVDHSAIGTDASGNGNHFQDENFAAGNTSQVWSKGADDGNVATGDTYYWTLMFNGLLKTPGASGDTVEWNAYNITFDEAIEGDEIAVLAFYGTSDGTQWGFNGTRASSSNTTVTTNPSSQDKSNLYILNGVTSLTSLSCSNAVQMLGIYVDGQLLIDANIQDTVKDTPLRNYAVLSEGGNGNLLANSLTAAGNIDATIYKDDFYFEVTMTAGNDSSGTSGIHVIVKNEAGITVTIWRSDTGDKYTTGDVVAVAIKNNQFQWFKNGLPVSLVGSGSTQPGSDSATGTSFTASFNNCNDDVGRGVYNFGQQPFAASNVTYDQDAGTVEIDGETYNTLFEAPINGTASTAVAESPAGTYSSGRLYCVLDTDGNVTDLQSEDPGYTNIGGDKSYTLTWPPTLPSGNTPDDELPAGSQICTYVRSSNDQGSDETQTNHIEP